VCLRQGFTTRAAIPTYKDASVTVLSRFVAIVVFACCTISPLHAQVSADHKTQHVIFVMTDGLRWQELFNGAEESLMNKQNGKVQDVAGLKKSYWRDDVAARREALMPFLWQVVGKQGQIFGNRNKGSDAYVTNHMFFSYPGYNETLTGVADDARINSNDKKPNPNVTVLEWLKNRPDFQGDIAAFGAWDVIDDVFNPQRSHLTANAGYDAFTGIPITPKLETLNTMKAELPHVWGDEPFDAIPFYTAMEYMKANKPTIGLTAGSTRNIWIQRIGWMPISRRFGNWRNRCRNIKATQRSFSLRIMDVAKRRTNGRAMARISPIQNTSGWHFSDRTRRLWVSDQRFLP
jgi:hypothetical protein